MATTRKAAPVAETVSEAPVGAVAPATEEAPAAPKRRTTTRKATPAPEG